MEENNLDIKNKINNFFIDKIFIYALIASFIASFIYANKKIYFLLFSWTYRPYTGFFSIDPITVESFSVLVIWFIYVIFKKPSLDFKSIDKIKFSICFSLSTTINDFITYSTSIKSQLIIPFSAMFMVKISAIPIVYGYIINMLIRAIIIFSIITTINVILKVLLRLVGK